MQKRGQVTVFIVMGILVLFVVAIILYYKSATTIFAPSEVKPTKEGVVQQLVTNCVEELGIDAITQLGQKGGYITFPDVIEKNPSSFIKEDTYGMVKVPLWYYQGESRIPPYSFVESQMKAYVESRFASCVNDFASIKNQYEIEELSSPVVTVDSAERTIILTLNYSIKISSKTQDSSYVLTKFIAVIPVRLKYVYQLAIEVMRAENEKHVLEDVAQELLTMHPDIPLNGMEFSCGQKTWFMQDIENAYEDTLVKTIPRVRFAHTNYTPFIASTAEYEALRGLDPQKLYPPEAFDVFADVKSQVLQVKNVPKNVPVDAYDYFHFFFDVLENAYDDFTVNVLYRKEWDVQMTGKPHRNGVLQSNVADPSSEFLRFFCVNLYHFVYDVYYPVEVVIHDPTAFQGKGYNFKFATPVILKNNEPDRAFSVLRNFDWPDERDSFCSTKKKKKNVDIRVVDAAYYNKVKDVNLSYECFTHVCPLGKTSADGGTYRLVTQTPSGCANGNIIAEKDLYLKTKQQLLPDAQGIATISMIPLKRLPFEIVKKRSNYHLKEPLAQDEKVTLILENKEHAYQFLASYPTEKDKAPSTPYVELIDKDVMYSLTLLLTKTVNGEDTLVGGFDGNWTVTTDMLYNGLSVNFTVYQQIPLSLSDKAAAKLFFDLPVVSLNLSPEIH